MHMMAERSREKFSLQRINCMIWPYGFSYFSAIIAASRLYTTVAVVPIPPVVEKTSGENEPCSISLIRSPSSEYVLTSPAHARAEYFLISGAAKRALGAVNFLLALFSAP